MPRRQHNTDARTGPHRSGCSSEKVSYPTRGEANKACNGMVRFGRAARRVYRCPECREWHITSQRESEKPPLEHRRTGIIRRERHEEVL